jgi:hypothetical protein
MSVAVDIERVSLRGEACRSGVCLFELDDVLAGGVAVAAHLAWAGHSHGSIN